MKKLSVSCGVLLIFSMQVQGDIPPVGSSTSVTERGLHHAVNEHVRVVQENGQQRSLTNRYTTLASGMHRMVNGELVEADPVIELHQDGAIAEKTQHKVKFLANINNWEGGIDLEAIDGKRFLSRPLGVSYYDRASGQSVLIAELKDSVGTLFPPNKIVYQDAFTDFEADLEYNNFRSGLQQNLIFRERPAVAPSDVGLNNETTVIELITEFFNPAVPVKKSRVNNRMEDDVLLDFGAMKIGVGKSFMVGDESHATPVLKQWVQMGEEGRVFLIEQIPYHAIAPLLNTLPVPQQAAVKGPDKTRYIVSKERLLTERPLASLTTNNTIQVASTQLNKPGFVLDYSILSGSLGNVTLRGDTTYYVDGNVSLDTLTIEGGAVLKLAPNAGSINVLDGINCLTEPYRPFVVTGRDDDSVGEIISGSTGNPTNGTYGGSWVFSIYGSSHLHDMRLSHLRYPLYAAAALDFSNVQFVGCGTAIEGSSPVTLRNVLAHNVDTVFAGLSGFHAKVEHLTAHNCNTLGIDYDIGDCTISMTNSLLVSVTNLGSFSTIVTQSVEAAVSSSVFQTVGAGSHYLAESSAYRDVGTTNINATLLSDLGKKTTYPPVVLTSFESNVVLQPQPQRDTDIPDLGYHYEPLDYAISNASVDTFTITNGAAIAFFGDDGQGLTAGTFVSEGSPLNLNRLVWYNTVQEQSTNWNSATPGHILSFDGEAEVKCRFTQFSRLNSPPGYGYHFVDGTNGGMNGTFSFQDCRFNSGLFRFQSLTNSQSLSATLALTNCLFERVATTIRAIDNPIYSYGFNNHFQWGSLLLSTQSFAGAYDFTFRDNFFAHSTISQSASVTHSNNAYYIPGTTRLTPTTTSDVIFSPINLYKFTNGPLGSYYQDMTNLVNKGSRTADLAALYHFTVTTNQVKETNSVVDIGLHYVAVDPLSGLPLDQDGDGLADYSEDANGNGVGDPSEFKWQIFNSRTDFNWIEVFTPFE